MAKWNESLQKRMSERWMKAKKMLFALLAYCWLAPIIIYFIATSKSVKDLEKSIINLKEKHDNSTSPVNKAVRKVRDKVNGRESVVVKLRKEKA